MYVDNSDNTLDTRLNQQYISRNPFIHKWNLGEGCQTLEGNSGI